MNRKLRLIPALMLVVLACAVSGRADNQNLNTNFMSGTYGLMIAYSDSQNTYDNGGMTIAKWNGIVNSFNVPNFVRQVQSTGSSYVVIYLGQNNGFFLGPNATYETAAGVPAGSRMSSRDLVMEVATALRAVGIKTMLYLPSGGPNNDAPALKGLGFSTGVWQITPALAATWASIIQNWSDHYGSLISGWWFDGYYDVQGFKDDSVAVQYAAAVHHGNPKGVMTFDPYQFELSNPAAVPTEDYTSGTAAAYNPPSSRWHNTGSTLEQWNTSFSINQNDQWGLDLLNSQTNTLTPRYTAAFLSSYLNQMKAAGGSAMLDVKVEWTGYMAPQVYNQLLTVSAAVNGAPNAGLVAGQPYVLTVNNDGMALTASGTSSSSPVVQQPLVYSTQQQWMLVAAQPGYYQLQNVASGLALNLSGSSAVISSYTGSLSQQWQVNSLGGITYQVANAGSGLSLEMPGNNTAVGTQFDQATYAAANAYQQFTLAPVPGAPLVGQTYEITVDHSGDALTANGTGSGSTVVQTAWTGAATQLWKVLSGTASGYYELQNAASGLALNISGASQGNGGAAIVWPYQNGGGINDQWAFLEAGNGLYEITNRNSGLALEVPGANLAPNTPFDQWSYHTGNLHQQFTLTPR